MQVEENLELSSDHSLIIVSLGSRLINKQGPISLTSSSTNWRMFDQLIQQNLSTEIPLKTQQNIDSAVEDLTHVIQTAAWESTPFLNKREKYHYECSKKIREIINEKRKLRKKWMRTRAPQNKNRLNAATKNLKKLLSQMKNQRVQPFLEGLDPMENTNYSLWKLTKKMNNHVVEPNPPIRKKDLSWAKSNKEQQPLRSTLNQSSDPQR